jgi:diguanylate cyclase (GGDEF)-like protein
MFWYNSTMEGKVVSQEKNELSGLQDTIDALRKEISSLKEENKRLQEDSFIDGLTGAYNKKYLQSSELKRELGSRFNRGEFFAVVVADLDHLKNVNDSIGHDAGDKYIQKFTELLRGASRPYDKVIRFGGDEFVVILYGVPNDGNEVQEMCQRMRDFVEEGGCVASFGIVISTKDAHNLEGMINMADKNMYDDKKSRRQ